MRGGAHNTSGTAVCDNGLMIDLSPLNEVTVDRRPAGSGSAAAPCSATSTRPPWPTAWPSRPG